MDASNWAEVKTLYKYYYYDETKLKDSEIKYIYQDYIEPNNIYTPIWTNEKRRSISAKESNRFNLL
jgi:hypothetical protein